MTITTSVQSTVKNTLILMSALAALFFIQPLFAQSSSSVVNPDYFGLAVGYGDTNWNILADNSGDSVLQSSVPLRADDRGALWGFFAGHQFSPNFAVEAYYLRYPYTKITFDPFSFYYPIVQMTSRTTVGALVSKFIIPEAFWYGISPYANIGISVTSRDDELSSMRKLTGTFGVGFFKNITPDWLAEIAFQYHTGFAKSSLKPALGYVPFLLSVQFRLAYRFDLMRAATDVI